MQQIQFKMVVGAILVCVVASYFAYLSVTPTVVHSEDDPETEILKSLYCQCGCGRIAYNCQSMDCAMVRDVWKPRIEKELQAGETKEQIINEFVAEYGEKVLVKPFEIPAWTATAVAVTVIVAVVVSAGLLFYFKKRKK